jgi:hypothetical protein
MPRSKSRRKGHGPGHRGPGASRRLIPGLLGASGAALVTLTKVDDLLLSFPTRSRDGRPCLILDPFGLATGLPELVWDPIGGCVDPMVAERRAKAFTAGTIKAASGGGYGDDAARFYAAEAAKVIQAFFHQPPSPDPAWTMCCVGWRTRRAPANRPRFCSSIPMPHPIGWDCCTARCTAMTAPPATPSPPSSRR